MTFSWVQWESLGTDLNVGGKFNLWNSITRPTTLHRLWYLESTHYWWTVYIRCLEVSVSCALIDKMVLFVTLSKCNYYFLAFSTFGYLRWEFCVLVCKGKKFERTNGKCFVNLYFSILEHTNVNCHLCIFYSTCRLFIHELFFGPLGLHLLVWSELGRSTWSPTWLVVDKGAWSTGICIRPTSKR